MLWQYFRKAAMPSLVVKFTPIVLKGENTRHKETKYVSKYGGRNKRFLFFRGFCEMSAIYWSVFEDYFRTDD